MAQAEIVFEYRSSEASGPAQDRTEFREGFFLIHDRLWEKINLRNDRQSYRDGLFRYDIPTFDEAVVREALLNAFSHRDYRLGGSVFVRQYAQRLEVVSPGGFPPGIGPENIIDRQNPRNRRTAEALARVGLVERSGQGLNVMVETAIRQSKPLPNFAGSAAHEVRLKLEGGIRVPAFVRFLERLGNEKLMGFSTYDFLALDAIVREQPLAEAMRDRIPGLVEAGAVEQRGRGRGRQYLLSRCLYASLGRAGAYIRKPCRRLYTEARLGPGDQQGAVDAAFDRLRRGRGTNQGLAASAVCAVTQSSQTAAQGVGGRRPRPGHRGYAGGAVVCRRQRRADWVSRRWRPNEYSNKRTNRR